MSEFLTYHEIDAATDAVRDRITTTPEIALILGSGLGELADSIENPTIIPTHEIPFWPVSTVPGHKGRLVIGELEGKQVLVASIAEREEDDTLLLQLVWNGQCHDGCWSFSWQGCGNRFGLSGNKFNCLSLCSVCSLGPGEQISGIANG